VRTSERLWSGVLPAARHRALMIWLLHRHSAGYVELAHGTRRREDDGSLRLSVRRGDPRDFLPGGASGGEAWFDALLERANRHAARGAEVFLGAAARTTRKPGSANVSHSLAVWLDIDLPEGVVALRRWCAQRTTALPHGRRPHLVVASGGSGGVHSYWLLASPLPALSTLRDGEQVQWIERANLRLIRALGHTADGRPVADRACRNRDRVLRLAGTVNGKSGRYARIVYADLHRPPYEPRALLGDLVDPRESRVRRARSGTLRHEDRFRQLALPWVYERLTGRTVPARGLVTCPHAGHLDRHPSCSLSEETWFCHACEAGGGVYDLASAVLGGPTGQALRGEAFTAAAQLLCDTFR
jgi:hypothetical protein